MAQCGATCFSMQWEEFAVKFVTWDGCDSDISDSSADSPRHLPLCAATGLLTQGKGLAEGKACMQTNCSATEIRWMNSGGKRRNRAECATGRISRRRRLHKAEFAGGQSGGKACRKTNCSATEIRWMNSDGNRRNRAGCATGRIRRRRRLHKRIRRRPIRQKLKQEG